MTETEKSLSHEFDREPESELDFGAKELVSAGKANLCDNQGHDLNYAVLKESVENKET